MGYRSAALKLYTTRFTLMWIHLLFWSFLWQSGPEYLSTSLKTMSEDSINSHLSAIRIFGVVCLALTFVLALTGLTLNLIFVHFICIVAHSFGALLVFLSIIDYWNVKLLWIPTILCTLFPLLFELTVLIFKLVGYCDQF